MSGISSPTHERRTSLDKFPSWVLVIGLTFTVGSLSAEETDTTKESESIVEAAVEKENSVSEGTSKEEVTTSDSTDQDEPTSVDSVDEEMSLKQLIAKAQKVKSEQDAEDDFTKSSVELGSYLPNGDPSSIVTVITNEESITRLYEEIERLSRFR